MSSWFVKSRSMLYFIAMLAFAALAVFLAARELYTAQSQVKLNQTQAIELPIVPSTVP